MRPTCTASQPGRSTTVEALGADSGISKSEVSRICAGLDEEVGAFRDHAPAEVAYPYVSLDATYCRPG